MHDGDDVRPAASSENARRTMQANRAVSRRELQLRQALWRIGLRGYRVKSHLPGRPDLTFAKGRVAVFVHGCFWHRCTTCEMKLPLANRAYWTSKFEENRARDESAQVALRQLGWEPLVVWEHDIRQDVDLVAVHVGSVVRERVLEMVSGRGVR